MTKLMTVASRVRLVEGSKYVQALVNSTYHFPTVFLNHDKAAKTYASAAQAVRENVSHTASWYIQLKACANRADQNAYIYTQK